MKLLSIITVCLNEQQTIERTIKSVIEQTWQDFEWIVIDGGSTDGTLAILNQYKTYIDVLISEPDKGIYNSMNKGINLASGKWLLFLNGGDHLFEDIVLEKVVGHLTINVDILYGNINFDNKKIRKSPKQMTNEFFYYTTLPHPACFIKKKLFNRKLYDEKYRISADVDFFIWAKKKYKAKFKYIDETISVFYHDGISHVNREHAEFEDKIIRKNYYNYFDYLLIERNWKQKIGHIRMVLTHPRYVAGWFKRLLFS